jgi:hypothetical protein
MYGDIATANGPQCAALLIDPWDITRGRPEPLTETPIRVPSGDVT